MIGAFFIYLLVFFVLATLAGFAYFTYLVTGNHPTDEEVSRLWRGNTVLRILFTPLEIVLETPGMIAWVWGRISRIFYLLFHQEVRRRLNRRRRFRKRRSQSPPARSRR